MTAQIVDINAVRLQKMLGAAIQDLTRTIVLEETCSHCSGAGLLHPRNGSLKPYFHDFTDCHKVDRSRILICKPCGGVGKRYLEVPSIGEAV